MGQFLKEGRNPVKDLIDFFLKFYYRKNLFSVDKSKTLVKSMGRSFQEKSIIFAFEIN